MKYLLAFLFLNFCTAQAEVTSILEFSWEAQEKVKAYEVELTLKKNSAEPKIFRVEKPEFSEEIPAGSYRLRIRSIGMDDSESDWSEAMELNVVPALVRLLSPKNGQKLYGKSKKQKDVDFTWTAQDSAQKYILRVWSKDKKFKKQVKTKQLTHSMSLDLGQTYLWQVHFQDSSKTVFESTERPFRFALIGAQLEEPVIEKIDLSGPAAKLTWKADQNSENFALTLYHREILAEDWKVFAQYKELATTEWTADRELSPGEYRLELGASSSTHISSKNLVQYFVIKPKLAKLEKL